MRSATTARFRELLVALPAPVQQQADVAYRLFRTNPSHPSLRFKPVGSRDPTVYSARVGRSYRAIGIRENDRVLWIWIGSHAEYDRIVDQS
ncbi:MAG: type II toxin-antitoxin system HigB family toxin [Chloroflexota bacterium]|nr:type II toxin-antitoxin system HigB family toxin [Chloroflexota bacterium]